LKNTLQESDSIKRSQTQAYHVIYAWSYLQWGGAQIYILSIIRNAPSNWRFTLLIPRNSKRDLIRFFEPYGTDIDFIDASVYEGPVETVGQKIKRRWHRLRSGLALYRGLKKYDPAMSVIHIDAAPWQDWILLFLLTLRTNVFFTLHNAIATKEISARRARIWRRRLNFFIGRKRFHMFSANRNAIDSMGSYLPPGDLEKITLTRATINPAEIGEIFERTLDRDELREKHGLPRDKFMVLCVGQFVDRKGRWVFLDAACEVLEDREDISFVWITPQPANSEEIERINEYGLGDAFRLILSADIGPTRQEVLTFFRAADIFALPSLWEGLPISILEAMALGVPTISTDINAIPEALKDAETGLLIKAGSSNALAEAILRLKDDPELRKRLAQNGREFVLANFDERDAAAIALRAYEEAIANDR
jgi:glycosyltransferase involved in cell wall biosynthesis